MSKYPTAPRSKLNLRGSAKIVSEFFEYSINSILFQRAIYPPEDFKVIRKYGMNILVTADENTCETRTAVRLRLITCIGWMAKSKLSKLIMAIISKDTGEVVERWQFDIQISNNSQSLGAYGADTREEACQEKSEEDIHKEIQALIRQITASVTFLPILEGRCTFNILVYADNDAEVPAEWIDSDPKELKDADAVRLRSFSTTNHKIDTMVSYRRLEDE